jgi:D-glycero-alpha-D-manno-heptose-7-phosphate kinase
VAEQVTTPRLVVARAPLRVSFVGGGSDLPPQPGATGLVGACVSSTIDLAVYCVAKPRTDSAFYLSWKEKEIVSHPSEFHHQIVRNAFADLMASGAQFPGGVELAFVADVPGTGSGLGSSAATAAACLLALDSLAERYDGIHGRRALAERSIAINPAQIKGRQDEYATVFGGLNAMRFTAEDACGWTYENKDPERITQRWGNGQPAVDLSPLGEEDPAAAAWLQDRFALFRPRDGTGRAASDVLATYKANTDQHWRSECLSMSDNFVARLRERDLDRLTTEIVRHNWEKEQTFGAYMTPILAQSIDLVMAAGALCAKLCGAGGTGHLLVGFEPERRAAVVEAAEKAWGKELKFRLGTEGACVTYREVPTQRQEKA